MISVIYNKIRYKGSKGTILNQLSKTIDKTSYYFKYMKNFIEWQLFDIFHKTESSLKNTIILDIDNSKINIRYYIGMNNIISREISYDTPYFLNIRKVDNNYNKLKLLLEMYGFEIKNIYQILLNLGRILKKRTFTFESESTVRLDIGTNQYHITGYENLDDPNYGIYRINDNFVDPETFYQELYMLIDNKDK